jgi:hypothetical protein
MTLIVIIPRAQGNLETKAKIGESSNYTPLHKPVLGGELARGVTRLRWG